MGDVKFDAMAKHKMEKDLNELQTLISNHFNQRMQDDQDLEDLKGRMKIFNIVIIFSISYKIHANLVIVKMQKRKEERAEQIRVRQQREKERLQQERKERERIEAEEAERKRLEEQRKQTAMEKCYNLLRYIPT